MITRRAFLGSLTGGLLTAPLAAVAQQPGKVYRIGYLSTGTATTTYVLPAAYGAREYVEAGGLMS